MSPDTQSAADVWTLQNTITATLGIATLVLGVISAYLAAAKYKLDKLLGADKTDLSKAKNRTTLLENYISSRSEIEYTFADAVIIGPRSSGKTSLAKLWTNALTEVLDQSASHKWEVRQGDICEFETEKKFDSSIGMERICIPTLRIRIRDYPGEERFRKEAMDHIGAMNQHVTLILTFLIEYANNNFHNEHKNTLYFNAAFVHAIQRCLRVDDRKIAKVFVVFNKADQFPKDWDENTIIAKTKEVNREAVDNIEQCFGEAVEFRVTSALTNFNVINLLGEIASAVIDKPEHKAKIKDWAEKQARVARAES